MSSQTTIVNSSLPYSSLTRCHLSPQSSAHPCLPVHSLDANIRWTLKSPLFISSLTRCHHRSRSSTHPCPTVNSPDVTSVHNHQLIPADQFTHQMPSQARIINSSLLTSSLTRYHHKPGSSTHPCWPVHSPDAITSQDHQLIPVDQFTHQMPSQARIINSSLLTSSLTRCHHKPGQGVQPWTLTKFPDFSLTFPWPFCGFPWPWDTLLAFHYCLNTNFASNLTNHSPKVAITK